MNLIEEMKDQSNIQAQIRDHVMVIEGRFKSIFFLSKSSSSS